MPTTLQRELSNEASTLPAANTNEILIPSLPAGNGSRPSALLRLALATGALATMEYAAAFEASGYAMAVSLFTARGLVLPSPRAGWKRRRASGSYLPGHDDLHHAAAVAGAHPAAEARLVGLGDKRVLFSSDRQAFIMYARQNGQMIALFDPVGDRRYWSQLTTDFMAQAMQEGRTPVFYQASESFLRYAESLGLRGYKLGERADIDVAGFDMKGKDWANLRRAINRAQRDGLEFSMVESQAIRSTMPELAQVSDIWLKETGTREKQFSLGRFSADYVAAHPVAVIRFEGRIVAFANIVLDDAGTSAFVDLMRFIPGVHRGVMDLLMVRIIEALQARGVQKLNLGMAPLSGLSQTQYASVWDRVGGLVFRHGNRFYNFEGLLSFKSKFAPQWTPRYLVVPRRANPFVSAAAAAVLIAGGWRGIVGR